VTRNRITAALLALVAAATTATALAAPAQAAVVTGTSVRSCTNSVGGTDTYKVGWEHIVNSTNVRPTWVRYEGVSPSAKFTFSPGSDPTVNSFQTVTVNSPGFVASFTWSGSSTSSRCPVVTLT
jgi:hypothetical protein